jgi:hypothetical protein
MKTTLALTLVAFLVGAWLAHERTAGAETAPVPGVVRAQSFELVDQAGVKRASLVVQPDSSVFLYMWDQTGTIRVKLGAGKDGSGMLLANETTEPGVQLVATNKSTLVAVQRGKKRRVLRP